MASITLLTMIRALCCTLLLTATALPQSNTLTAIDGTIVSVGKDNSVRKVFAPANDGKRFRLGTTEAMLSQDKHWIAYVKDHNAWLRPVGGGAEVQVDTVGAPLTDKLNSIESYLLGFSDDSKYLLYSVAVGPVDEDDLSHVVAERPADYGTFLYSITDRKSTKPALPADIRVHRMISPDEFFITQVGNYGDEMGFFRLPSKQFSALPKSCASAFECDLSRDAKAAACTTVRSGKSSIARCDVKGEQSISQPGTCLTEFRAATISPQGKHVAYIQTPDHCAGTINVLWIDAAPGFKCEKLTALAWIDDVRILAECSDAFVVVSSDGKRLGSLPRK